MKTFLPNATVSWRPPGLAGHFPSMSARPRKSTLGKLVPGRLLLLGALVLILSGFLRQQSALAESGSQIDFIEAGSWPKDPRGIPWQFFRVQNLLMVNLGGF